MKEKKFDEWNEIKKGLDKKKETPFYHEREIWWCSIGVNIGVEIDAKGEEYRRPVVVLKGFNKESFLGVALTGRKRTGKYYVYLGKVEDRKTSANLSQIKLIDTKRLVRKITMLEEDMFNELLERVKEIISRQSAGK
ncbi:MAG: type II toxin-antitoxin system PemK/MazF family toxin [Candidatus Paceibacterota bacterium]